MFYDPENEEKAKNYAIYVRKSNDDPQKQVRSIEDQLIECQELVDRYKLNLVKVIEEERSAKRASKRPRFTQLLKDIRARKIDGLIAWHPDRLARNMKEAGEIIDLLDEGYLVDLKFASMHYVNDYNGKVALGITFVMSKQYSDKLSVDVRRALQRSLKEGKSAGQFKPGYCRSNLTGYYEPDESKVVGELTMFEIVRKAWEMRIDKVNLEKIVNFMNEAGYKRVIKKKKGLRAKKNQLMSAQKLSSMFNDPFYYGLLVQGGEAQNLLEVCDFTPVVTEDEFLSIQSIADIRRKRRKHSFPFRGLLICKHCGRNLTAGAPKGGGGRYLTYWCYNKECTGSSSIRAQEVIRVMGKILSNFKLTEKEYEKYLQATKKESFKIKQNLYKEKSFYAKRLKVLDQEIEELIEQWMFRKKDLDEKEKEVYEKNKASYESGIKKCQDLIKKVDRQLKELKPMDFKKLLNTLKTLSTSLKHGTGAQKDDIAQNLFLNLVIDGSQVATVSLKEPFMSMLNDPKILNGGPGWI
ncbi:recombinase family protein [Candidatus Peregrinibacteria bacterium]|jgi:site-specific DNA recombinase|nr:recombinase family protein [Candidatus Peregrinibacteria bacterium]MBT7483502.1 recombinase family protein [Candidatus Peregrinibacteria bacterium]MBT7702781.1 recombinase family protein [Candidatus Peregrinibacteria bacterium]